MLASLPVVVVLALAASVAAVPVEDRSNYDNKGHAPSGNHTRMLSHSGPAVYYLQYGFRPYYIINNMTESPLKRKLRSCENGPFEVSGWSVSHRGGATTYIPEHTAENHAAGARMGAGIMECDVVFTNDMQFVCRHSQCDLHTTTDILLRPALAAKCTQPFKPANGTTPASALCCTSDITLAEYKTLCGKMDGSNSSATTPRAYQSGTPAFRTDLYDTCGTLLTLDSYIDLVNSFPGYRNFTPELKTPPKEVAMPFKGMYTQQQYARDMINTFIRKNIHPSRVWAQSFNGPDIFQWIKEFPEFGKQALYLDEEGDDGPSALRAAADRLASLKAQGVNIIAPPINYLIGYGDATNRTIAPSYYAQKAKEAGLEIVAWTFERSGPLTKVRANNNYYYETFNQAISYDGQLYEVLDLLANNIGIKGLFSDDSGVVSFFANCFKLQGTQGGSSRARG